MPYVNKPRPYKKEYQQQLDRGDIPNKLERQKARRKLDAKGVDRAGKDVAHVKALSKGGSNADGVRLESPAKNRSFKRNSDGSMK
jgi:hypothetical protein